MLRACLVLIFATLAAGPVNDTCPVSGDRVDGKHVSELKINFCCANCKGRFDRDPIAALRKIEKLNPEICPLSGKPVGDAVSTVSIALCKDDCKAKFDKEPAKYFAKPQPPDRK